MKRNKTLKLLILSLCLTLMLCLTACKDSGSVNTESDADKQESTQVGEDGKKPSSNNTQSGIELEEDVFDDDDITNTPSENINSNSSGDKNNQSTNQPSDKTESNSSSDTDSESPTDDSSENEGDAEKDADGTIKLPIDWFN